MYKVYSQNNKEFYAFSSHGDKIVYYLEGRDITVRKLSVWIDELEKHFNGGKNTRRLSVCDKNKESVFYFNIKANEWRRLSDDYDENTSVLNPLG